MLLPPLFLLSEGGSLKRHAMLTRVCHTGLFRSIIILCTFVVEGLLLIVAYQMKWFKKHVHPCTRGLKPRPYAWPMRRWLCADGWLGVDANSSAPTPAHTPTRTPARTPCCRLAVLPSCRRKLPSL